MSEINSGVTLVYRIKSIEITSTAAVFNIASGYYDTAVPPNWVEIGGSGHTAPIQDVVPIMLSQPEPGLSRREDMLKVWSQYFLDKGWIAGTLVPSL